MKSAPRLAVIPGHLAKANAKASGEIRLRPRPHEVPRLRSTGEDCAPAKTPPPLSERPTTVRGGGPNTQQCETPETSDDGTTRP